MTAPSRERRAYRRFESHGPVALIDPQGKQLPGTRMENVSDGGIFLTAPIDSLPPFGGEFDIKFKIPRTTPNTYMLEEVKTSAKVIRQQPMLDGDQIGVGLRFRQPLELMIEV